MRAGAKVQVYIRGLLMRKIDSDHARGYQLTLKPHGRKTAVRVIGAFDRMQREFESRAGKVALRDILATLRNVDKIFSALVATKRDGLRERAT